MINKWAACPVGTKAFSSTGGYWIKIITGRWKWCTGNAFTTPGGDVVRVELPLPEYLICNPHPLADMICQQARTGQPVWVKIKTKKRSVTTGVFTHTEVYVTTMPNWNLKAEYRFIPFEEEV